MYTSVRASCGGKPILLSPDPPDSVKVVRTFEVTRSYLRRRSAAARWKTSGVGGACLLSLNSVLDAMMVEVARCLSLCVSHALSSAAAHSPAEQFGAYSQFSRLSRPITFISRHLLTSLLTYMLICLLLRTISFFLHQLDQLHELQFLQKPEAKVRSDHIGFQGQKKRRIYLS